MVVRGWPQLSSTNHRMKRHKTTIWACIRMKHKLLKGFCTDILHLCSWLLDDEPNVTAPGAKSLTATKWKPVKLQCQFSCCHRMKHIHFMVQCGYSAQTFMVIWRWTQLSSKKGGKPFRNWMKFKFVDVYLAAAFNEDELFNAKKKKKEL